MKIVENASLADYTSMHVGGPAKRLITLEDGDDLVKIASDPSLEKPLWILGYGTNSLISDKGLPGTVILDRAGSLEWLSPTRVRVSSGLNWDELVQVTIERGLWGLELTSGVPGGTGAAVVGNIAAYGQQIADTLVEAQVLNTSDGTTETWTNDRFKFDYRFSVLALPENQHLVIVNATFELSPTRIIELTYDSALKMAAEMGLQPDTLQNCRQIILAARKKVGAILDASSKTAGSFFKNPLVPADQIDSLVAHEEFGLTREQLLNQNQVHGGSAVRVSAAHVLLAAGFERGQTWGQVRLHPNHILKVENIGSATAQDIYNVVQEIIKTVHEKLNINLEPEVRFIGEF